MTFLKHPIITQTGAATEDDLKAILNNDLFCPPWRNFKARFYSSSDASYRLLSAPGETDVRRGETFQMTDEMVEIINAALYLRRPLLITGKPGTGKSSLVYAVAHRLGLGKVLRWPVNSRSSLKDAIYSYDAIGRLQDAQLPEARLPGAASPPIGQYLRLGPLGTALLPYDLPRALLIDEIDKSDVDLPNDLLNIFEEGEYEIPELARLKKKQRLTLIRPHDAQEEVEIVEGRLRCLHFPFVVLTSNGERDFSAPFLRRCLRIEIKPTDEDIKKIIHAHLGDSLSESAREVVASFLGKKADDLATDQLLNAVFLVAREVTPGAKDDLIEKVVLRPLNERPGKK